MEKKRKAVNITELDVEPISNEDLAAIAGAATEISYCGCIFFRSDIWWCDVDQA
jgi:hypothetical protein